MRKSATQTGEINHITGIYHSECHSGERTILEGQEFPRCGYCNCDTTWMFMGPTESDKPPSKISTAAALPARRRQPKP